MEGPNEIYDTLEGARTGYYVIGNIGSVFFILISIFTIIFVTQVNPENVYSTNWELIRSLYLIFFTLGAIFLLVGIYGYLALFSHKWLKLYFYICVLSLIISPSINIFDSVYFPLYNTEWIYKIWLIVFLISITMYIIIGVSLLYLSKKQLMNIWMSIIGVSLILTGIIIFLELASLYASGLYLIMGLFYIYFFRTQRSKIWGLDNQKNQEIG